MFVLRGAEARRLQDKELLASFVGRLVAVIDMDPVQEPLAIGYPIQGKGGVGYTVFQAIATSYIALDTWPELNGGAILVVCTCKAIDADKQQRVAGFFAKTFKGHVETTEVSVDLLRKGGIRSWGEFL